MHSERTRGNSHKLQQWKFKWVKRKENSRQDYFHTGTVCPERLQNLHPWRFSFFLSAQGRQTLSNPALVFSIALHGIRDWTSQPHSSLQPKLPDSSACVKQSRRVPACLLLRMWCIQAATTEVMSPNTLLFSDKLAASIKYDTEEKTLGKDKKKVEKLV